MTHWGNPTSIQPGFHSLGKTDLKTTSLCNRWRGGSEGNLQHSEAPESSVKRRVAARYASVLLSRSRRFNDGTNPVLQERKRSCTPRMWNPVPQVVLVSRCFLKTYRSSGWESVSRADDGRKPEHVRLVSEILMTLGSFSHNFKTDTWSRRKYQLQHVELQRAAQERPYVNALKSTPDILPSAASPPLSPHRSTSLDNSTSKHTSWGIKCIPLLRQPSLPQMWQPAPNSDHKHPSGRRHAFLLFEIQFFSRRRSFKWLEDSLGAELFGSRAVEHM